MYYDLEAPGGAASVTRPPPPFRVDVVTGCDAAAGGSGAGIPEAQPLAQLYFCDSCSRVVSRRELSEDVDSYYCPNCLELMPSSEAALYGMRCSKCWECPVCFSTLTTAAVGAVAGEQTFHLACGYCRWSSRGRFEAQQPEVLFAQIMAREREGEPRQRMAVLAEAFRTRAQEQQRERELAQRLRRRSSVARGTFAASSIGAYAARRFSSAMILRAPRIALASGHHSSAAPLDGARCAGGGRPWNLDDLDAKLREQAARAGDIRGEARAAAKAAPTVPEAGVEAAGSPSDGSGARAGSVQTSLLRRPSSQPAGTLEIPVLQGLSVEELLRQHTQPGSDGRAPLLKEMQRSLEEEVDRGMDGVASLPQRLQQISGGYASSQAASLAPAAAVGELRSATVQLEAPLQHAATWALLPLRKPLLTKRSRRCRLLTRRRAVAEAEAPPSGSEALDGAAGVEKKLSSIKEDEESAAGKPKSATHASLRVSAQSDVGRKREEHCDGAEICKSIVVKPQINPCFNPPFQKNNTASTFIPRCIPWTWCPGAGAPGAGVGPGAPGPKGLMPGEEGQLVFTMSNPLDTDVELHLDARAFNSMAAESAVFEQNVEVLTAPIETAISRFNDLADVHEVWGEETERMKLLKAQDDPDVIPDRKLHKILVRLRFRALAPAAECAAAPAGDPVPWVFFARAILIFTDASSAKHEVHLVLRFGAQPPDNPIGGGTALLNSDPRSPS